MAFPATLTFVMAGFLLILGFVNPRRMWWRTAAWQYRNPQANEPSEQSYQAARVTYFVFAVLLALTGFVFIGIGSDLKYDQAEVRSVVDEAASELSSTEPEGLGLYSYDVEAALAEAGDANRIQVKSAGDDRYEVTNEDGRYPVCLTVRTDSDLDLGDDDGDPWERSVSTSVDDGPC